MPGGPTITFKIEGFTLSTDVRSALKKNVRLQPDFKAAPLLVMRNVEGMPNLLFRSIFPSMSLKDIKLKRCRRVVLIDNNEGVLSFRHYMIKSRPVGISQPLKKLEEIIKFLETKSKYNEDQVQRITDQCNIDKENKFLEVECLKNQINALKKQEKNFLTKIKTEE